MKITMNQYNNGKREISIDGKLFEVKSSRSIGASGILSPYAQMDVCASGCPCRVIEYECEEVSNAQAQPERAE